MKNRNENGNKKLSFADVVLSFDDQRHLVQTTMSWDTRHCEESMPEYGAFLYQIREAGKESANCVDLTCKTTDILCNTLFVTLFIGVSLALPVAMVSIGVKYLEDCPKEPRIPVYLLVGGCFGVIKLLSSLWRNIQTRRYHDVIFDDPDADGAFNSSTYRTMDTLLFLFLFGWQIAGTFWTFNIWTPHFEQLLYEPSNWCDKTVYMFTVYQLFTCYVVIAAFVLVLGTILFLQKCCCS
ncbi:transmembrane protein 272-like [Dreissena polymorpha]|nr:transmembrane protein 272-like [Dreissena polymorpha]